MKYAVLSDIHANLPSLVAVLDDAANQGVNLEDKAVWCLGDVVGYGPHPREALTFLREYADPRGWVLGNHDAMLADLVDGPARLGKEDQHTLLLENGAGAEVTVRGKFLTLDEWRKTTNSPVENIRMNHAAIQEDQELEKYWKKSFTLSRIGPKDLSRDGLQISIVHASRAVPLSRYQYPWDDRTFLPTDLKLLEEHFPVSGQPRVQFYGHTHVPMLVRASNAAKVHTFSICPKKIWPQATHPLDSEYILINPGSVGQPRNLDPRACYCILDTAERTVTFRRVAYDWQETAHDLQAGRYSPSLVERLPSARADEKITPDDWLDYYREAATK
jgi:predicted phosphodiesterase